MRRAKCVVPILGLLVAGGSAAARVDPTQYKYIVLVDGANPGRRLKAPVLHRASREDPWKVYAPIRPKLAEFFKPKGSSIAEAIPDAVLVELFIVSQRFASPLIVETSPTWPNEVHQGHGVGTAVDFRVQKGQPSEVWSYVSSQARLRRGAFPGRDGSVVFHIEAGTTGCWTRGSIQGVSCGATEDSANPTVGPGGARPTRFLRVDFVNLHDNGRRISIPLFYDTGGRMQVWPPARAKLAEFFRDRRAEIETMFDDRLLVKVAAVFQHFKKPIRVVSGVRYSHTVQDSRHPKGQAMDFQMEGVEMSEVWRWCRSSFDKVGVGYYPPTSDRGAFVHLDVREKDACWVFRSDDQGPACGEK